MLGCMSFQAACDFGEPCLGNCNGSDTAATTDPGSSEETGDPASCCVGATIEWASIGGDRLGPPPPPSRIDGCDQFSGAFPADSQGTCSSRLPSCGGDAQVDAETIRAAIAHPDVQSALAGAPRVFGIDDRPVDGSIFEIVIDDQSVLVGRPCEGEPQCEPIPAGVQNLVDVLRATTAQQATAEMCSDDLCSLPPVSGNCDAAFPRFYFDADTGTCQQFIYGGCEGNENNFQSHSECYAACGGEPIPVAVVVEAMSCEGVGVEVSTPGDEATFSRTSDVIEKELFWGCGCPSAPEFVLTYEPTSPLTLRLCYDDAADPCEAGCQEPVSFDLGPALQAAGATDFVFADPYEG